MVRANSVLKLKVKTAGFNVLRILLDSIVVLSHNLCRKAGKKSSESSRYTEKTKVFSLTVCCGNKGKNTLI